MKKSLADLKNDLPIMDSVELLHTKGGNKQPSKWSNNSCGGLLPQ